MNLEEIKTRAEEFKSSNLNWLKWAADTILQLVAEVERLQRENQIYKTASETFDTQLKADQVHIKKLTAANKILRDGLVKVVDKYFDLPVEQRMVPQLKEPEYSMIARKALAEADEVLK